MVGSFPDERSALMLVCARVRYVTSNEWSTRRYLDMSRLGETVREANRSSPQGRAKTKVRKTSGYLNWQEGSGSQQAGASKKYLDNF